MCVCACVRKRGHSVIHAYVAKQVRHGLSIVDAADGLRQYHADVHRFNLWTLELLELMGDCVGHHHLGRDRQEREREGERII